MNGLDVLPPVDEVLGSVQARLFTPPLVSGSPGPCGCGCALDDATSYGFAVARFADEVLGRPLWAWQRWLVVHAGELLPDGCPRFRRIVVTVGRQSGKTDVLRALTLYWLFVDKHDSVLGTSTLTKYAKKPWQAAFKMAVRCVPEQMPEDPVKRGQAMRSAAGEEDWWTADDCHYSISASNAEGGRSMSNQRVIADELAKQYNYDAYEAAYYSMDAFEDAQYWGLTTPDPKGVVYKDLRAMALRYINTGEGNDSLALFEWSAPEDSAADDVHALACANPTIGWLGGKSAARMVKEASDALAKGGDLLRSFKTEIMCVQVDDDDRPIPAGAWTACLSPGDFGEVAKRVVLCFDVGNSAEHATLSAAAMLDDGRVRVAPVKVWQGRGCADLAARELPALVAQMRPKIFAWLPGGPAAAAAAKLKPRNAGGGLLAWPPPGVEVQEVRGELAAVCMAFAASVQAGKIAHPDDPLLNDDVAAAEKLARSSGSWVFSRKGNGVDCDALYSTAGAAYVANQVPLAGRSMQVLLPRSVRR